MILPDRTAAKVLAEVHYELRTAISAGGEGDEYRQHQYARSALDSANEVILDPSATSEQRSAAQLCAAQARTLTGDTARRRARARAAHANRDRSTVIDID